MELGADHLLGVVVAVVATLRTENEAGPPIRLARDVIGTEFLFGLRLDAR